MKNKHERAWRALREIARREGVTLLYVVRSIEEAVEQAYANARQSNDVQMIALWDSVPREGVLPSAVEMIEYLSEQYVQQLLS